ncbi:MAG: hypothetical protein Q9157_001656 [Trypethelium eluteriae]
MLPPFGFSVGDFITTFSLINKVRKAIKETGGTSTEESRPSMNQRLEHSQQQLQLIQIKADENTRSLSSQLDKVTAEVRLTSELARIDTRRLLQICAGLQVGIERIEKRQRFQPRKTQDSRPRRIARTEHQTSSLQRDARSLKWFLHLTTHTVSQLLQRFSNLSKEILEYSKNI